MRFLCLPYTSNQSNKICDFDFLARCFISSFHHHIRRVARTELTIFLHSSLLSIASGRSASCTPVSSVSSFGNVFTGLPTSADPCLGSQSNTSLTSSSFLLKQRPAKCVLLSLVTAEVLGSLPYSRWTAIIFSSIFPASFSTKLLQSRMLRFLCVLHSNS